MLPRVSKRIFSAFEDGFVRFVRLGMPARELFSNKRCQAGYYVGALTLTEIPLGGG